MTIYLAYTIAEYDWGSTATILGGSLIGVYSTLESALLDTEIDPASQYLSAGRADGVWVPLAEAARIYPPDEAFTAIIIIAIEVKS